jgi:hypothetical protein
MVLHRVNDTYTHATAHNTHIHGLELELHVLVGAIIQYIYYNINETIYLLYVGLKYTLHIYQCRKRIARYLLLITAI